MACIGCLVFPGEYIITARALYKALRLMKSLNLARGVNCAIAGQHCYPRAVHLSPSSTPLRKASRFLTATSNSSIFLRRLHKFRYLNHPWPPKRSSHEHTRSLTLTNTHPISTMAPRKIIIDTDPVNPMPQTHIYQPLTSSRA